MADFRFSGTKYVKDCKITHGFIFFLNGYLSQWHGTGFVDKDGIKYLSAEHYMMYHKAKTFNDTEAMDAILKSNHPGIAKRIGRNVKNFDHEIWKKHREEIVYNGNILKFSQNPMLLKQLLDTKNKTLVEASPDDNIWGIGKSMDDPTLQDINSWGENLLGKTLMRVREDLKLDKNSK